MISHILHGSGLTYLLPRVHASAQRLDAGQPRAETVMLSASLFLDYALSFSTAAWYREWYGSSKQGHLYRALRVRCNLSKAPLASPMFV